MTSEMVWYQTDYRHSKCLDPSFLLLTALLATNGSSAYYSDSTAIELKVHYCCSTKVTGPAFIELMVSLYSHLN